MSNDKPGGKKSPTPPPPPTAPRPGERPLPNLPSKDTGSGWTPGRKK